MSFTIVKKYLSKTTLFRTPPENFLTGERKLFYISNSIFTWLLVTDAFNRKLIHKNVILGHFQDKYIFQLISILPISRADYHPSSPVPIIKLICIGLLEKRPIFGKFYYVIKRHVQESGRVLWSYIRMPKCSYNSKAPDQILARMPKCSFYNSKVPFFKRNVFGLMNNSRASDQT